MTARQADSEHEVAQLEAEERRKAELCERDRIAQEHLEKWQEDQKELKRLEAKEHKLQAQKLQLAAEQREVEEEKVALQALQAHGEHLWEIQNRRVKEMEAARDRWIKAGEEESLVEDTSIMDYSIVEEQGRLPDALSKEEESVYAHLVKLEANNIQW